MTDKQKRLRKELEGLSEKLKTPIRNLSEKNKTYLSGSISDYQFWLYEDGEASFSSEYYDRRFEKYDFKSDDDLIVNFIGALEDGILRKDYFKENPSKSPTPLFNRLFDWLKGPWNTPDNEKK